MSYRLCFILCCAFSIAPMVLAPRGSAAKPNGDAKSAVGKRRAIYRSWGPEQVTGKPDTASPGDRPTAWASASQDSQDEWLELEYATAIVPVEIHVYETYNPGALHRIVGYTQSGMDAELWVGDDPTDTSKQIGVSKVKPNVTLKTNRIRIFLRSKDVSGWNEIDAVGLVDEAGKTHWATAARASTTYAGGDSSQEFVTKSDRPTTSPRDAITVFPGGAPAPRRIITSLPSAAPPIIFTRTADVIFTRPTGGPADPRDARIKALEAEVRALRKALDELKKAGEQDRR